MNLRSFHLAAAIVAVMASAATATAQCAGDCDQTGSVTVDELVMQVTIALGNAALETCLAADGDASGAVTVDELLTAVNHALNGCPPAATPSASASPSAPTPTATAVGGIPTDTAALVGWLEAGSYLGWPAESGPHRSAGPHFGTVRTFVNPILFTALEAGSENHPQGSALVKELYGSGPTVRGWSLMVKVESASAAGVGWYWLERYNGSTIAAGLGAQICTGCHSAGNDFVLSPFPLQ